MIEVAKISKSTDTAVRQRLLSCATQLFTRKGYTATTVREIVEAAGVTKPVLYYYFRNKEGIYLELIRGAFAKFDALLDASRGQRGSATETIAPPLRSGILPFYGKYRGGEIDVLHLLWATARGSVF